MLKPSQDKLPSIDGWRAISICMVLGAHSGALPGFPPSNVVFNYLFDGNLGVRFFFVISGFLITYLLIQEYERTGDVSLKRFYVRRSLRILPVYMAYLAVVAVLQMSTALHQSLITWIGDLTFTINFLPRGVISGHLWSLAVEEQFYLLWPGLFLWAIIRTRRVVLALTIPVIAAILCHSVVYANKVPWIIHPLFHGQSSLVNFDSLAIGCMAAFALAHHRAKIIDLIAGKKRFFAMALGLLLIWLPGYNPVMLAPVLALVGNLFQTAGFAILLLTSILCPAFFKPLNWPIVAQLGIVSYSIYIWQQIFYARSETYGIGPVWWLAFPGWLVPVLAVGFLSYYGFERPLLKLRMRFRQT